MIFNKIKKKIRNIKKRQDRIAYIAKESGWSRSQVKLALKKAKEIGMPDYRYVKNECWKLSEYEIVELNERIVKRLEEKQAEKEFLDALVEKSGLSSNQLAEKLKVSRGLDIKDNVFEAKHLWELSDSELEEYAKASKRLKRINRKKRQFYISVVCQKTGWDFQKAKAEMDSAKEKGIPYLRYVQRAIWSKNEDEVNSIAAFYKGKDKTKISDNTEKYFELIKKQTGWSHAKTELEIIKTKVNCGASYEDIFAFKLYEKTPKAQRGFVTLSMFERMRLKFNEVDDSWKNFNDKAKFNENFDDLIVRKWFVNRDLTYDEFLKRIDGVDKLIIKPISATQGIGIEVVKCNESPRKNKEIYKYIMGFELSIVEEYIVQHEEMSKFCPSTVNTVRVMTLNFNGECKFLYSVFRMGKAGVVDNFHAGGVAAGVDLETGVVCTNAVNLNGDIFTHSPATNEPIKGFRIPHWDKIVEICKKASLRFETTRLVGWDFAVTENGAELIEGNPGGSYVVAQLPFVEDGIGLYDVMVGPYLPEFAEDYSYNKKNKK